MHNGHRGLGKSRRVALLLKHDWERAKQEAKPFFPPLVPATADHLCKIQRQ